MEADDYIIRGHVNPKPQFIMSTRPMMKINLGGIFDVHLTKYDDHISASKPSMCMKNLMFGGFYIDIEGIVETVSHSTGSRVEAEFIGKSGDTPSHLKG